MMKSLLVHGCYDLPTLQTLSSRGVRFFGFDLRARSQNLVTYQELRLLLNNLATTTEVVLVFENDLPTTIYSFLDLLKDLPQKFILEFRDYLGADFYKSLDHDFFWTFQPDVEWKSILSLARAKGILLPVKLQEHYQDAALWKTLDEKNLRIFLHTETLAEAARFAGTEGIELSLDLGRDVEISFRQVDQDKLRNDKFWRKFNENTAGQ